MKQAEARDTEQRRTNLFALVLGLAIFWFVLVVTLGVLLFVENKSRVDSKSGASLFSACLVPGVSGDSARGYGVWQSWPPGTRCERGEDLDVAPTAPRVWGRPGAWRGGAVVVLALAGGALACAFWVVRDRDP